MREWDASNKVSWWILKINFLLLGSIDGKIIYLFVFWATESHPKSKAYNLVDASNNHL